MMSIILTWKEYTDMWNKILKFKEDPKNGRLPYYVDVKNVRITTAGYQDAARRVTRFRDKEGRSPNTVELFGTKVGSVTPPTSKPPFILKVEDALGGKFNNFTEFYNLCKNRIHCDYANDIYPQGSAVQRLKEGKGLNCSDWSQIGYAVAKALGYKVRYVHVYCTKSKVGHIRLQVAGKELGANWVGIDLSAAAENNYPLGRVWCGRGPILSYDDPWLLADDGKT